MSKIRKTSQHIVSTLLEKFAEIRKSKKMSHAKVAKLAGIHPTTISLIENKKRTPSILTCLRIAMALEIDLADLIKLACEEELIN